MFKRSDREILALAIPSIITNITTPLLSLMDVVIVGHMGDASSLKVTMPTPTCTPLSSRSATA